MGVQVTWEAGGEGEVTEVSELHITVLSTRPFPPGAPARGTLHDAEAPRGFALKVAGSKREPAGERFHVRGRLVSATVDVRRAFARAVAGPEETPAGTTTPR